MFVFVNRERDFLPLPLHRQNLDVPSATDNTVKVSRCTVLNDDGRMYEVLDDLVVSEHHRLLVRTASDYEVDEKFTRRADGTNVLLNSNGELIVGFPGTVSPRVLATRFVLRIPISARLLYFLQWDSQRLPEWDWISAASSAESAKQPAFNTINLTLSNLANAARFRRVFARRILPNSVDFEKTRCSAIVSRTSINRSWNIQFSSVKFCRWIWKNAEYWFPRDFHSTKCNLLRAIFITV